jgi:hypothetical protein
MRKNNLLTTAVLTAIAAVLIWLLWPRQSAPTLKEAPTAAKDIIPATSYGASTGVTAMQGNDPAEPTQTPIPRTAPVPEDFQSGFQQWLQNVQPPIAFYGKVVDENQRPVEGASVEFLWTHIHPEADFKTNTLSDADGRFSLTKVNGFGLDVHVSKPGYYAVKSANQDSFDYISLPGYQPFHPDPQHPIVFHLRRKGPGTALITSDSGVKQKLSVEAPLDGTPVWVDLLARKTGESGQMQVRQVKPEYLEAKQAKEWSFSMSILHGGFVEQDDEFPFEAPESGYQPVVELTFKADEPSWTTHVRKRYYMAFGQPRVYGWLILETQIGMRGARLHYAINPEGSRYLEPKENQPARRELPPGVTEIIPGTPQ